MYDNGEAVPVSKAIRDALGLSVIPLDSQIARILTLSMPRIRPYRRSKNDSLFQLFYFINEIILRPLGKPVVANERPVEIGL